MPNTNLSVPELGNKFIDYRKQIWGSSYDWMWARGSDEIKYVVIHHSGGSHDGTPDTVAVTHKKNGWLGIGYHFIITKDGNVYYVGDIGTARANVKDMNEKVIGICLVGDFTKHLPSDEQIESAHLLCQFFIDIASVPNVNSWDDVVGHKELQATLCPGTSWDKAQDGDMSWRIKTGTIYTKPEENVEEAGKTEAITANDQLFEDVNVALRLPAGNKSIIIVRQKCAELLVTAENYKTLTKENEDFIKEVAHGIGSPSETKTGVTNALTSLEERVLAIKKQKVIAFSLKQFIKLKYFKKVVKKNG